MPNPFVLTETAIRQRAGRESLARGEEYFERGAVVRLARRGEHVHAEVEGSAYEPYQVTVKLDELGVHEASCSCPFEWGGDCKHIVATLLACLRTPEEIEERPPLSSVLADLRREQRV